MPDHYPVTVTVRKRSTREITHRIRSDEFISLRYAFHWRSPAPGTLTLNAQALQKGLYDQLISGAIIDVVRGDERFIGIVGEVKLRGRQGERIIRCADMVNTVIVLGAEATSGDPSTRRHWRFENRYYRRLFGIHEHLIDDDLIVEEQDANDRALAVLREEGATRFTSNGVRWDEEVRADEVVVEMDDPWSYVFRRIIDTRGEEVFVPPAAPPDSAPASASSYIGAVSDQIVTDPDEDADTEPIPDSPGAEEEAQLRATLARLYASLTESEEAGAPDIVLSQIRATIAEFEAALAALTGE